MLSYYIDSETALIPAVFHYMTWYHFIPQQSQFGIIVNYYKQLGILINNDLDHKIKPPITTGVRCNLHPKCIHLSQTEKFNFNTLRTGDADLHFLHYNCGRRMTQICVFNRRLFSLHSTLNYAIHNYPNGPADGCL